MSNKLHMGGLVSGSTYAFIINNSAGNYRNASGTPAFEAYNASNIANYANGAATANTNGDWFGVMPTTAEMVADDYTITLCLRAGGSLTISDTKVAGASVPFDGTNIVNARAAYLAANGLNAISIIAPTGRAANFREMVVQLFRRFFSKTIYDSVGNTIKTYADDGTTVVTTQTTSDTAGVQTVGPA